MKLCSHCKIEKSISEFNKNKSKKDGLQHNCVHCQNKYTKRHYRKNKKQYTNRNTKQKKNTKEFLSELKKKKGCFRCGFDDPRALQFHHRDSKEKEFSIGSVRARSFSKERLLKEIEKCEVLSWYKEGDAIFIDNDKFEEIIFHVKNMINKWNRQEVNPETEGKILPLKQPIILPRAVEDDSDKPHS